MNVKRFILAAFALFVFTFIYEMVVHAYILMKLYVQTPALWRTFEEVSGYWPLGPAIQFALSVWLALAFTQLCPLGGLKKGLLFGLFFGGFAGILSGSHFLWMPISQELGLSWFVNGVCEGVLGGAILGTIYRR